MSARCERCARTGRVVMVTGSRGWSDRDAIYDNLYALVDPGDILIQGGARGADKLTMDWAARNNVLCRTFAADPTRPSPQRYHERNDSMLRIADEVIAFWDGESRGTRSVIEKAEAREIPVVIVSPRAGENWREQVADSRQSDGQTADEGVK